MSHNTQYLKFAGTESTGGKEIMATLLNFMNLSLYEYDATASCTFRAE